MVGSHRLKGVRLMAAGCKQRRSSSSCYMHIAFQLARVVGHVEPITVFYCSLLVLWAILALWMILHLSFFLIIVLPTTSLSAPSVVFPTSTPLITLVLSSLQEACWPSDLLWNT